MALESRAREFFGSLQDEISTELERVDGRARFCEDRWEHRSTAGNPGGGITRVLTRGAVFEKAGVNLAEVRGTLTERLARRMQVPAQPFYATGISLVVHPLNPMVPTVHMNLRYLRLHGVDGAEPDEGAAWFGGGADLTPYYLFKEDVQHFHRTLKAACNSHDPKCYGDFKKACDEYFRIAHRDECRGVGGIFFDYLREDPERTFRFVQEVGNAFLPAYLPIVTKRKALAWWDREREWQLVRRGRYVEFNLVYDRGTLFGLETGGRTESVLMSMPPLVRWAYDHHPPSGSREAELIQVLKQPRNWI